MRRNHFGDPQPSSLAEILAAMDEVDLLAEHAQAELFEPDGMDDPPFDGWCAEISDAETGEKRISTLSFPSREALESALEAAGILLIEVI